MMARDNGWRRVRTVLVAAWLPAALIALWWYLTAATPNPFFPPLPGILGSFVHTWFGPGFMHDIVPSLVNLFVGLGVGVFLGLSLGILLALVPVLELVTDPYLQFLRAMPGIAMLPLMLIVLGANDLSKIVLITYGTFWPVLLNTVDGVKAIAPQIRQTGRSYRVTRMNTLFRVILPGAFPQASVGLRLSLTVGLVLMVASEYYGSMHGIGNYVIQAMSTFHITQMWSGVILLGMIGYLLTLLYDLLERRLLAWRDF